MKQAQDWLNANAPKVPGAFRMWGGVNPDGQTMAGLRADQEKLAASLVVSYGDAIAVKLGMFEYPVDKAIAPVCRAVKPPGGELRDLEARVVLTQSELIAGADLTGHVVITNTGKFSVSYLASVPLQGVIVRRDTDDVVGNWDGSTVGTDLSVSLAPGESKQLDFVGGTASCYPSIGYTIPPGDYDVLVESLELRNTLNRVVGNLTVAPAPLTIDAGPK